MIRTHQILGIVVLLAVGTLEVFAQADDGLRDWTVKEKNRSSTIRARAVAIGRGKLTLREASGTECVVPLAALPKDERQEALISVVGSGVVVVVAKDVFDEERGIGSGFVFHKSGLIFTSYHVVQGAGAVGIEFRDNGGRMSAECLAVDRENDVAVLKVSRLPDDTHILTLSPKRVPKPGDQVWTIGHPKQLKNTISWGNVNAVRKSNELPEQLSEILRFPKATRWIQTDAVITHGSSGGPLLDSSGEVIGMNTFIAGPQLGFALHLAHARSVYEDAKLATSGLPLPIPPSDGESSLAWLSREIAPIFKAIADESQQIEAAGLSEEGKFEQSNQMRIKHRKAMLEVINKNPSDWPAFQAAYFVCSILSDESQESRQSRDQVCKVLLEHHLQKTEIGVVLPLMVEHGDEGALEFCRHVMEECSAREVKVQASAAVALLRIQSLAASPSMNLTELQSARNEVEVLARSLEQDYNDIKGFQDRGKHMAQVLRSELANMRVGLPAIEIKGVDIDGNQFKLSDYKGKVVVLDFFVDWCPHCKRMYPLERKLVEEYKNRPVAFLGVNGDNQKVLSRLIREGAVTWRCWAAGASSSVFEDWKVASYPTIFLIDHAGVVRRRFSGEPSQEELAKAIATLVSETGRDIEPDQIAYLLEQSQIADAAYQSGSQLRNQGEFSQAREQYDRALSIREKLAADVPHELRYASALLQSLNGLAWILATAPSDEVRDGERAIELATRACDLNNWSDPRYVDTLAAAYAESGDFDAAVKSSEKALAMLHGPNDEKWRLPFASALESYKKKKPTRQGVNAEE